MATVKKLLSGCLIVAVLGVIGLGVAGYFAYRAASPYIQQGREYVEAAKTLPELDARVESRETFTAPPSGELTASQVERFARVQRHLRTALGTRVGEIEKKYESLKGSSGQQPSPGELFSALREFIGLFVEARRYQVDALNKERFSQSEYDWVRARVYAAAGVQLSSAFDLRQIEEMVRTGGARAGMDTRTVDLPEVPARNRALVKPYMNDVSQWLPLAFFGL